MIKKSILKKPVTKYNIIKQVSNLNTKIEIFKKDDNVDYFKGLLDHIPKKVDFMGDVEHKEGFRWCLRHDVDHDLDISLYMARAEMQRGYKSTFFLLTPSSYPWGRNYYGWLENGIIIHDEDLIDKCKLLIDFGHRIGLHNDIISLSFLTKREPHEIIEREVEFFAKHGIYLEGTAAHGNPLCRKLQYNNRELFEGCIRKGREYGREIRYNNWIVKTHSLKLEDYGFAYEAYSLPRHSRLSESGRIWRGLCNGKQIDKEKLNSSPKLKSDLISYVKRIGLATNNHSFQLMTHPDHWMAKLQDGTVIKGMIKKYTELT